MGDVIQLFDDETTELRNAETCRERAAVALRVLCDKLAQPRYPVAEKR
jgi:hypothetical protein